MILEETLIHLAQYGIAGIAIYMMYRLYDNHLTTITDELGEIKWEIQRMIVLLKQALDIEVIE